MPVFLQMFLFFFFFSCLLSQYSFKLPTGHTLIYLFSISFLHIYFIFYFVFILFWSTVDLKCCIHFKCTAKWSNYTYIYTYIYIYIYIYIDSLHCYVVNSTIVFSDSIKSVNTVKVTQLCPSLCDPMDCSLPGSSVHGILQSRIREWVAIPFSRGSFQLRSQT